LILPVLALLFLSILQIAFILAAQIGITNAVREAARLAATTTPTFTSTQASTNGSGVLSTLTNSSTGLLKKNVMAYASGNLVTSGSPKTEVCYSTFSDAAGKFAVKVKVEAYYRHPLFIPIVGAILDNIDGVSDGGFQVGASEEMRVENDELATNPLLSACTP
jgi:Flp pilus assembly protein TadG